MLSRRLSQLPAGRSFVTLQSEKRVSSFSDKVVRDPSPKDHFKHPTYVMAREKMLSTIWKDIGIFKYSVYGLVPFFTIAAYYQA